MDISDEPFGSLALDVNCEFKDTEEDKPYFFVGVVILYCFPLLYFLIQSRSILFALQQHSTSIVTNSNTVCLSYFNVEDKGSWLIYMGLVIFTRSP